MRWIMAGLLLLTLCCAAPVAASGKAPQDYRILTSTTGDDFPAITWLDYWNAAFVGFGETYQDAFAMARDAAARSGWETANIAPASPAPVVNGPVWVILMIHTVPPGGDTPPIIGSTALPFRSPCQSTD
ncbi:MAG: hypothetical protein LC793_03040 [Thermomicrobia bacterium]|nr:hypothetical protein [Thermomicrobia bacterium]